MSRIVVIYLDLSGAQAQDREPPLISASLLDLPSGQVHVTLSAQDDSGVQALRYSLDDVTFQPYTTTLVLDPANTSAVYAFADDQAGNRSGLFTQSIKTEAGGSTPTSTPTSEPTATNTPTPTATGGASTLMFAPEADARVKAINPDTNYGTSTYLDADSPGTTEAVESYLRFTVTGVAAPIQNVKLRLYATTNGTTNGPALYASSSDWTESGITWNTRPTLTSGVLDNKGAIGTSSWVEYDVTALVTGNGSYSLALIGDSDDGVTFSSREGSDPPQLVLTLPGGGSATATPTSTPTATTGPTATPTSTPVGGTRLKTITFEDGSLTHATSGADSVVGTVNLETSTPLRGSTSARVPDYGAAKFEPGTWYHDHWTDGGRNSIRSTTSDFGV